ncbi:LTA synthase family protein [Anaerorhabdus sp.]|uniref:LTA synthase family protein n=1 Tax=Anaerorhabdus sp. TaxID=1872524 RepID=UPI002FC73907
MKRLNAAIINWIYIIISVLLLIFIRFTFSSTFTSTETYLFLLFIALFFAIITIIPRKWNMIIGFLIPFLYGLYIVSQTIYYRGFNFYYRLSTALSLQKELSQSKSSVAELIKSTDIMIIVVIILVQIIFIVLYFFAHKPKNRRYYISLILGGLSFVSCFFFFNKFENSIEKWEDIDPFLVYKTDYYVYDSINSTSQFVKLYGPTTLFYRDAQTLASDSDDNSHIDEITDYLSTKETWGSNEYTGLLKDKSILVIQAESLANAFITPELTPTLFKLKTEGLYFENFSAPLLPGSTSDSEFMANIGLIPESDGYASSFRYVDNEYPTTLAKMFKQEGYNAYAYHNNFGEFYNRSELFPNLGYDFFGSYELGLETESCDSITMEAFKYILLEDPKFLAFWITYSGHQPYGTPYYDDNIGQYAEEVMSVYPTLNMEYITIMCKTVDLDRSIAEFMQKAEDAHRMDDIVIVVYGDHAIKGNYLQNENLANIRTLVNDDSITKSDLRDLSNNPLIIYNSELESEVIETVSTTLDIAPTIYNLFGIEIDESTVLGRDILAPNNTGLYFDNFGFYATNDFMYDCIENIYQSNTSYPFEKAQNNVLAINYLREISKYILQTDYYKVINE